MRFDRISNRNMHNRIALFVCALLLFGMLFSSFFIANEYLHECAGEECPICRTLADCEAFVNQISSGLIVVIVAFLLLAVAVSAGLMFRGFFSFETLVTRKVRLNN